MLDRTFFTHTTSGSDKYLLQIEKWMDGGGLSFGLEFPKVIRKLYPDRVFNHCLDWCSGAGTIGFEILSNKICNHLTLMDTNGEVLRAAKNICKSNNIEHKVKLLPASSCVFLPKHFQYDLVVANPPHFEDIGQMSLVNGKLMSITPDFKRRAEDKGWKIHEDFFNNIKSRLTSDGVILLQENVDGSSVNTFSNMIVKNGLKVIDNFVLDIPLIYYIVIAHE